MAISEAEIRSTLGSLVDPNTGKDYVTTRSVKAVRVSGADVEVDLELGYPGRSQFEPIRREVTAALKK
jgi:ATP-binding protein involved in chromosome partitioning